VTKANAAKLSSFRAARSRTELNSRAPEL